MSEGSKTIGFRLELGYKKRLEEEARKLGIAPGTLARRLVVEALEDRDRSILRLALARLEKELSSLRDEVSAGRQDVQVVRSNLKNATLRLLTAKGPMEVGAANDWAKEHMKR